MPGSLPQGTGREGENLVFTYVLHGKMDVPGLRKAIMPSTLTTEILRDCERTLQAVRRKEAETGHPLLTLAAQPVE